ncbi:MAG TPA: thiamine-phosphate kinase [Mycobacteriales bacterium]|nr:thiamine-phosphate kinase [Mycobacteriales bacterium]
MADATAGEIGEDGLISAVTGRLRAGPQALVGPGDDAAVVATPDGRVVATTDVLVEGVHFRRDWSAAYDVGRKAAAANLADVAAMGGVGTALLVGLTAPADLPVAWVTGLADGLRDEAALVGAALVGGDTVRGGQVVVSVTALGDLQGRRPVLRSGARDGDVVVVAGELGGSAAGLALLLSGHRTGPLVEAHLRPTPPYHLGPVLADAGATSMCDVSDGLVVDLLSLCRPSRVGVLLDVAALPAAAGAGPQDVLHGGEDHALLATVPLSAVDALADLGVVAVGRVRSGTGVGDLDGRVLEPRGWQHFS